MMIMMVITGVMVMFMPKMMVSWHMISMRALIGFDVDIFVCFRIASAKRRSRSCSKNNKRCLALPMRLRRDCRKTWMWARHGGR